MAPRRRAPVPSDTPGASSSGSQPPIQEDDVHLGDTPDTIVQHEDSDPAQEPVQMSISWRVRLSFEGGQ